jgi:membrane-bound metal-dependent hydrolase YbcI (DUF457 family)
MAGFKTHISVSTTCGVIYGVTGFALYGVHPTACVVAGGLCSISGMLPDLDSDSGVPVREMISLLGAIIPMMMINRFRQFGWSEECMACAAIIIYCLFRFGVAKLFKKYTVHRGMWHSIPACFTATLLAFLIVSGEEFSIRAFKAMGVFVGFMSHLILDEIWSFKAENGRIRIAKSFGTALKFYSDSTWANISTYAKLIIVALLAFGDPVMMERFDLGDHHAPQIARQVFDKALGKIERARDKFAEGQGWRLVPRDAPTPKAAGETPPLRFEPSVLPAGGEAPLPLPGEPVFNEQFAPAAFPTQPGDFGATPPRQAETPTTPTR